MGAELRAAYVTPEKQAALARSLQEQGANPALAEAFADRGALGGEAPVRGFLGKLTVNEPSQAPR